MDFDEDFKLCQIGFNSDSNYKAGGILGIKFIDISGKSKDIGLVEETNRIHDIPDGQALIGLKWTENKEGFGFICFTPHG